MVHFRNLLKYFCSRTAAQTNRYFSQNNSWILSFQILPSSISAATQIFRGSIWLFQFYLQVDNSEKLLVASVPTLCTLWRYPTPNPWSHSSPSRLVCPSGLEAAVPGGCHQEEKIDRSCESCFQNTQFPVFASSCLPYFWLWKTRRKLRSLLAY